MKYRHASDPQISRTAKDQAPSHTPPIPAGQPVPAIDREITPDKAVAPAIITTAPAENTEDPAQKPSASTLPRRTKMPEMPRLPTSKSSQRSSSDRASDAEPVSAGAAGLTRSAQESRLTFEEPEKPRGAHAPPPYGDESSSSLALPVSRLSESSRSDGSGEHGVYASTTTTHTISTTTTFFRLPRRKKKDKGPLFPLPARTPPLESPSSFNVTPRASTSRRQSESPRRQSPTRPVPQTAIRRPLQTSSGDLAAPPVLFAPSNGVSESTDRETAGIPASGRTSPVPNPGQRARSPTKGSLKLITDDDSAPAPSLPASGRTSSSTAGRPSLGGVFAFSRLRQNSEPQQSRQSGVHPPLPGTPISTDSKPHSFSLTRETVIVPDRQEGETPAKYLIRLEESVSRHLIATVLSQKNDEFFKNVLRSYMRGFKFFGEPLDMAVRKMLMEVELPKETQQIDRVLQSFANRYHECNPGVYASPDEAYFIAFSILILHTDVFNKNNKNKMQKQDYTKNARGQGVADEILECFYDNIAYTPFIHVEGDLDLSTERMGARKLKKNLFSKQSTDPTGKPSREPVDPYTVILDSRMDSLRPPLKDVMSLEDHYNYLGSANSLNLADLSKSFYKTGVLQIVSSRSRPDAFTSPETMANPAEAHPGVVDMKVTKVGILWRKDAKRKKGRSPWQEWGAILTGTSLYFFRNTSWIKSLIHQHDSHHRHNVIGNPCVFKPPLEQFKPDVLMPTQDAVALVDMTYKKHKNALIFVRHGGIEETFLADNESDMNDWLAKLNYAAAFRTAGVHMRDLVDETTSQGRQSIVQRQDSDISAQSAEIILNQTMLQDQSSVGDLAQRVRIARRELLRLKIAEADDKLAEIGKQLEAQLRNARHLQILAPIQNKTREQIVLAAGGMAAKVKWMRLDFWRARCHRDILAKDLEEDLRLFDGRARRYPSKAPELSSTSPGGSTTRPVGSQEEPITPLRKPSLAKTQTRPSTQPSPEKSFSLDDVFAPMQPSQANKAGLGHRPRGSWELPPLSFQPTRTSMASGSSTTTSSQQNRHTLMPQSSLRSVSDFSRPSETADIVADLTAPGPNVDPNEQEILKESGVLESDNQVLSKDRSPTTPETDRHRDIDNAKTPDTDFNDGRSKVRRSLHRTLRESAHGGPTHHRSKKGKDSASSTLMTETSPSQAESEVLARGTGSFTVHGKKASVITFGSEWQSMSPEERISLRKQAQSDGSKLSVPSAIEDEVNSMRSGSMARDRPISAISTSTTTMESTVFEEAPEVPIQTEVAGESNATY